LLVYTVRSLHHFCITYYPIWVSEGTFKHTFVQLSAYHRITTYDLVLIPGHFGGLDGGGVGEEGLLYGS
jgi:hypothetical protein